MFKTNFGSSWVKAMKAFTDVTKLVESFGLRKSYDSANRKTVDKSVFQCFNNSYVT